MLFHMLNKSELLAKEILKTENKNSFIKEPINPACKLAVSLPVYDEDPVSLLECLASLSVQKNILPADFEVVVIVNNNKQAAKKRTKEFLNNQKILKSLYFLQNEISLNRAGEVLTVKSSVPFRTSASAFRLHSRRPEHCRMGEIRNPGSSKNDLKFKLSTTELALAKEIINSKINIRVINKSSLACAYKENNVAIARNRAAAEIYLRFQKTKIKNNGIIVIVDCDNIFSLNFVASIISTFEKYKVNACSGQLQFYFGKDIKNIELMKKVMPLYLKRPLLLPTNQTIILQNSKDFNNEKDCHVGCTPRNDGNRTPIISCCPNLSVTVSAYFKAGGFPNKYSGAGTILVNRLNALPGFTAVNLVYSVGYEIRSSEHCGMFGFGRTVKYIESYVDNFVKGKTKSIFAPDYGLMKDFMLITTTLSAHRKLNMSNLLKAFKELKINIQGLNKIAINGFLQASKKDALLGHKETKFKNMEKYIIENFFGLFARPLEISRTHA